MKVTNCSMGCLYATGPLSKCLCACGGETHGLMVAGHDVVGAKCSPAVEARCKGGLEDGACRCACKGLNHALYRHAPEFATIKITGLEPA